MIENQIELSKLKFKSKDPVTKMNLTRLAGMLDMRWHLDRGDYPMNFFAASTDGDAAVPIYPQSFKGRDYLGLRHGLLKGIFAVRQALVERGATPMADKLIQYDRERS